MYGHPLAGLYWEIFCHDIVQSLGFKKVEGWECLFTHEEKKMFLSIYVDDFKLAGPKGKLAGVWKDLEAGGLGLDPPTPLHENVYLGCGQFEFTPTEEEIAAKSALYRSLVGAGGKGQPVQNSSQNSSSTLKKSVSATDEKEASSSSHQEQVHVLNPANADKNSKVKE